MTQGRITLALVFLLATVSISSASDSGTNSLKLENGNVLVIVEIEHSRSLPWAYYDQAMKSIPLIYPDAVVVTGERLGKTVENSDVLYSFVGYQEMKDSRYVIISGVVTHKDKAWKFDTRVEKVMLAQSVHLVLQQLGQLPFN